MARRKSAPTVTAREAKRRVEDYHFSDCRAENHVWKRVNIEVLPGPGRLVRVQRDCTGSCGGSRFDVVNLRTGELEGRSYKLPKGYRLQGFGDLLPSKSEWRKSLYSSLIREVEAA